MVLDLPEEDGNEGIPSNVGLVSLLHENIRLVQKDHSIPPLAKTQDTPQRLVGRAGVGANLACAHRVQRFVRDLGHCLGRQRLSAAWPTAKQPDETPPLSRDDVVKSNSARGVLLNEGRDEPFLFLSQYKPVEWLCRPLNIVDSIDCEAAYIGNQSGHLSR